MLFYHTEYKTFKFKLKVVKIAPCNHNETQHFYNKLNGLSIHLVNKFFFCVCVRANSKIESLY